MFKVLGILLALSLLVFQNAQLHNRRCISSFYLSLFINTFASFYSHREHNFDGRPSNASVGHAQDSNTRGGEGGVMRGKIGFNQLHLAQVPNGTREGCTRGTHEPETMHEETQAQSQALGNLQQMFG